MADFCAFSSLLRSEGLGFAREASADLPSGGTSLREDSRTLRVCLMADFYAFSSLLRSEGLGFAREASADLPSGGTSLREVVKDAPSLPDGRLLRLQVNGVMC
ncbi:hypothetical protein GCWU000341_01932 [Oribacterium sp. oral taxon 078 str. F0262]|nr:hypothetical protein GCWU000341_01932 [Oribacterium sp. oral taxon 078 str. F0262]